MNERAHATFYDGITARPRSVTLELTPDALAISGEATALWPYAMIARLDGPARPLRLTVSHKTGEPEPRLEIVDEAFIVTLRTRAPLERHHTQATPQDRRMIWLWGLGAVASCILVIAVILPAIAERLATIVPPSWEIRLGQEIDPQIRASFGKELRDCTNPSGLAALKTLVTRFEQEAGLSLPLKVVAVDHPLANAFAVPGGHIYLFRGLIDKAKSADEVAGVLAHEIGHIRHRDGLKAMIHSGGLGFIFGTLFGDFTGGTAIMLAGQTLIQNAASREAERDADAFGIALMRRLGGDPRALASILETISAGGPTLPSWLSTHPMTPERAAAIRAASGDPSNTRPVLNIGEWTALRKICDKGETNI